MKRHIFFAAAFSLAFAMGCGPTARGGSGSGVAVEPAAIGRGGGSAVGADEGSTGAGGAGKVGTKRPLTDPTSDVPIPCSVCSAALGGSLSAPLCGQSRIAYDRFLACACTGICATACGNETATSCLDAWSGNPPLECKTCLVSATGCGATWDACLADDGVTLPGGASSSSGGPACACDAGLPLCPGGGSCATPGPFDAPGNTACGTAEYCAPCCDPGGACGSQGTCKVTLSADAPCSNDYECCSGVCTAGRCDGGCGFLLSF